MALWVIKAVLRKVKVVRWATINCLGYKPAMPLTSPHALSRHFIKRYNTLERYKHQRQNNSQEWKREGGLTRKEERRPEGGIQVKKQDG